MLLRIYTGEDGQTHFEDMDFPAPDTERISIKQGDNLVFRRGEQGRFSDWHHPGRRQYLFLVQGRMEITIGDGSTREMTAGDVLLAEDMTGQGHQTKSLEPTISVSVPLLDG